MGPEPTSLPNSQPLSWSRLRISVIVAVQSHGSANSSANQFICCFTLAIISSISRALGSMQKSLLWALGAAVFVFSISKAPARDLGQWDDVDPLVRKWFRELNQPDNPSLSCCGETEAYWADSYEVKGDQYVAIITDTRDDKKLGRAQHIEAGTRIAVPNRKIKWGSGNPTGHGIIFIGLGGDVFCYLPPGGG